MAFNYSPKVVTEGLVLYLDAANTKSYPGSGTVWNDLSRSGNNGALISGSGYTSANGGAITFDGVNDYVASSNLRITLPNSFSIGVWVFFNNANSPTFQKIFHAQSGSINTPEVNLDNFNGGTGNARYHFYTYASVTSTNNVMTSTNTIVNNTWGYVTGVYDNTAKIKYLYINGTLDKSGSTTVQIAWPDSVTRIGRRLNDTEPLNGRISTTHVYNRALTAQEVLQNYNATKSRYGL